MMEVDEAIRLTLEQATRLPATTVALQDSVDYVLAEEVTSDVDSPPHDKSVVDGYAVVASDLAGGSAELDVLEEVTAGETPTAVVKPGSATRIMTGAPVPDGADAIVMIEQTELIETPGGSPRVRIRDEKVTAGQKIMQKATSLKKGDAVLPAGRVIRPVEVGLLAEVGRSEIVVVSRPTVSVLATGNELVSVAEKPAAGRIRNSNSPMLTALVRQAGGEPVDLGIGRDDEADLRRLISQGLQSDVLLLSGGVSMGVLDLVPQVFSELGVRQVFHKVRLKPGKPIWFGVLPDNGRKRFVFGLPGNPVSSFVCFELFVRPALLTLAGKPAARTTWAATLSREHFQRGDRPAYWPGRWRPNENAVEPLNWTGSSDLRTLASANCLAFFPAGERTYLAGENVCVIPIE